MPHKMNIPNKSTKKYFDLKKTKSLLLSFVTWLRKLGIPLQKILLVVISICNTGYRMFIFNIFSTWKTGVTYSFRGFLSLFSLVLFTQYQVSTTRGWGLPNEDVLRVYRKRAKTPYYQIRIVSIMEVFPRKSIPKSRQEAEWDLLLADWIWR